MSNDTYEQCTTCDKVVSGKEKEHCESLDHKVVTMLKPTLEDDLNSIELDENEDILTKLTKLISKTVKGDDALICRILFNGLSAFTKKPSHLMVMERSSEGKTYPALEIAQHFPKENVLKLGSATPQTFKYEHGTLVNDDYEPIQIQVDKLGEKILVTKDKRNKLMYEKQKMELTKHSKTLIDLRNKWIIFKEPPHAKLLEALYSTLSNDEEYNEHKFVNKSGSGKNQNFTVVFRGCPAILICTAKDESKNERWLETFTRFEIVSPIPSIKKYQDGMNLIGKKFGLPTILYNNFVISEQDKELMKDLVFKLIKLIKSADGQVLNVFVDKLSEQFPHEVGYRWRQFQRFNILINLHCFCYSLQRPKWIKDGEKIPMVALVDIKWANTIMQDNETIPPNKLRWFNDVFVKVYNEHASPADYSQTLDGTQEKHVIRIHDIVEHIAKTGGKANARQIRQVYLDPLFDHDYVEKDRDPDNKSRDVYWTNYTDPNSVKSPLDSTIPLDESCVRSFLEKYLKWNFTIEYKHAIIDQEIIPVLLSDENSTQTTDFVPKNGSGILELSGIQRNQAV